MEIKSDRSVKAWIKDGHIYCISQMCVYEGNKICPRIEKCEDIQIEKIDNMKEG